MEIKREFKNKLKTLLQELKLKYPDKKLIKVSYNGSGDSFDSMWVTNDLDVKEEDIEDIAWLLIERSNADFNNEGSEGDISIDLETMQVELDNYYIYYERNLSDSLAYNLTEEEDEQGTGSEDSIGELPQ